MAKIAITDAEKLAAAQREIIRLNIKIKGARYGLHDQAEDDVLGRLEQHYLVHPDDGRVLSKIGEPLEHALDRLSRDPASKHLFGKPKTEGPTAPPADLAKMDPMERLRWANENPTRNGSR